MVTTKSAVPVYAVGVTWLVWAWLMPLYSFWHFVAAGLTSFFVFVVLGKVIPPKVEYVSEPIKADTGVPDADELLRGGLVLLGQIRDARAKIKDDKTVQKVEVLEQTLTRIFVFVTDSPASAQSLRKFMNYYLPTLKKLVETYVTLESQGIEGENIASSMRRIESILDTMNGAMEKQLDALFGDTALDIGTDITVLEGMLAQEGLDDGSQQLRLE